MYAHICGHISVYVYAYVAASVYACLCLRVWFVPYLYIYMYVYVYAISLVRRMSSHCVSCIRNATKIRKSITEGKHDQGFMAKLEQTLKEGEIAVALNEILTTRICTTTYTTMKAKIEEMQEEGISPTENICRFWAILNAEFHLSRGNLQHFVDSLRLWVIDGETFPEAGQRSTDNEFDISMPLLWRVAPVKTDEEAAEEEEQEEPPEGTDPVDFEIGRLYDKATRDFSNLYLNGWACDGMYTILKDDHQKALKLFEMWVSGAESFVPDNYGPKLAGAMQSVTRFAKAYVGAAGDGFFTPDTHDAFTQIFVSARGKQTKTTELHKLLAITCRKNAGWKKKEAQAIRVAAMELEAGPKMQAAIAAMDADERLAPAALKDILAPYSQWVDDCRPGVFSNFEDKVVAWAGNIFKDTQATAAEGSIDVDESIETLRVTSDCLSSFTGEAAVAQRSAIAEHLKEVVGSRSARAIIQLSESVDLCVLRGDGLVAKLDALPASVGEEVTLALDTLFESMQNILKNMLADITTDHEYLAQLMTNFEALSERASAKVDTKLARRITQVALEVQSAFARYQSGITKTTSAALTKACLAFKKVILKPSDQTKYMVEVLRMALQGNAEAFSVQSGIAAEKAAEAQAELQGAMSGPGKIAFGLKDGSSWKKDVGQDLGLKKVLDHASAANGLLSGPGAKVLQIKTDLTQAMRSAASAGAKERGQSHCHVVGVGVVVVDVIVVDCWCWWWRWWEWWW